MLLRFKWGIDDVRSSFNPDRSCQQDFTQLKVANGAMYPFDKELLQVSSSGRKSHH